jgi:hypothetical protein
MPKEADQAALCPLSLLVFYHVFRQAASCFRAGMKAADHVFELHYNAALLAHRQGDLQEAFSQVRVLLCSCAGKHICAHVMQKLYMCLPGCTL